MNDSDDKENHTKIELRCDPKQLEVLKKCSEKRDMTEWNNWRKENPDDEIWLQRADLEGAYLELANLRRAHLEHAYLYGAHLAKGYLSEAHLEEAFIACGNL